MTTEHTPALLAFQAAMRGQRKATGLRQKDVAERLGFSRARVNEMENDPHSPSLTKAEDVARVFGMELHEFLEFGKKSLDSAE